MAKIIAYRVKQIYGTKTCLTISYNDAFQLVGFFVSDWLRPGFTGILSALRKGSKCAKPGRQVKIVALTSFFSLHIVAPFFGLSEYRFCSSQSCPGPLSWHGCFVHLYNTCTVPRMWLEMTMCEASETVHQLCFVDSTRLVGLAWFSQCSARHQTVIRL